MTCETTEPRYCARCGTKLSRYNSARLCGPCNMTAHDTLIEPPRVPLGFWLTDQMHDALATWHMGRVVYAYRTHPFHGKTLPQETVGNWLGLTQAQLSRIEKGAAPQQLSKLIQWARILNIPADLLWFKLPATENGSLEDVDRQDISSPKTAGADTASEDPWELDDVLRRTLLINASAAGVSGALGLELARHGLSDVLSDHAYIDIDDWYEIVREYGDAHNMDMPKREYDRLLTDVVSLQGALAQTSHTGTRKELSAVGALLSHYMAQTVGDLGRRREAMRWWRTAQAAADVSGNRHIMCFIRGRRAIRAIYEGRPPGLIIDAVDAAQDLMVESPVAGWPSLLAARAQSYALVGQAQCAEADLQALRETFTALPPAVTADHGRHCWAYPAERVRFAESFVYSHLGNIDAANKAQQSALALYPPNSVYGPMQIELQHALCLVRGGDYHQGAAHAVSTLGRLPAEYQIREIVGLGEQVLAAVPPNERNGGQVKDLRELIRSDALSSQPERVPG